MRKKKYILLFLLIFFLIIFYFANKETTRTININYKVTEYKIPLYLKVLDFYDRHYNYKFLIKQINKDISNKKNITINITKWINDNINKIPAGVEVVDNHPLTIVERRLGTNDQFSDLLSVLLVYANIDSFFMRLNNDFYPLTLFKINNYWSIIDPYYGIYFTNDERVFASIEDIKNKQWQISNVELEKINSFNFKDTFGNKFSDYNEVKNYYDKIFNSLPSSNDINNTNIYNRGGRSYIQSPFGRIRYEIYKIIKLSSFN